MTDVKKQNAFKIRMAQIKMVVSDVDTFIELNLKGRHKLNSLKALLTMEYAAFDRTRIDEVGDTVSVEELEEAYKMLLGIVNYYGGTPGNAVTFDALLALYGYAGGVL